jgi:Bifunctional DNA primase/polymerase, N-terminal
MRPSRANYDEALRLLGHGFRHVHLIPGGKVPEAVGWQRRGGDLFSIDEDFSADPSGNNGVQMGSALDGTPILALDLDRKELLSELSGVIDTNTTIVETARGVHLWLRGVIGNHVNFRGHQGVDIRGAGGYVVAPSSYNAERDFVYRFLTPLREPAKLAEFHEEWFPDLRKEVKRYVESTCNLTPDLELVYRYCDRAEPAISGNNGHGRTFGLACRLVRTFPWLTFDSLLLALRHYNLRAEPPWSERELIHKCNEALKKARSST